MGANPRVCILRTAGTNCDKETAFAFQSAGAVAEFVHINSLVSGERSLSDYHILALPGGFSYGDDVAAGKILANELRFKLAEPIKKFLHDGKLMIGICNGFQILVKAGLLPGNEELKQEVSLIINDSGKFEDRWVYLRNQRTETREQKCIWVKGLPEVVYLPVAHGEGKFVVGEESTLKRLQENGQVVFRYSDYKGSSGVYPDNPNGSLDNIAGICDETGRILGLMPHPERHSFRWQHPLTAQTGHAESGDGFIIFKNGVDYARRNL